MESRLVYLLVVIACLSGFIHGVRGATTQAAIPTTAGPVCELKADYLMLMDRSGSITEDEFEQILDFMRGVVDGFTIGADGSLFGAISFATQASVEFLLDKYTTKPDLDNAIGQLVDNYEGGLTNIAEAFEKACEVVEDDGNRAGIPDIAVLITDAVGNVQADQTLNKINALKKKGVAVCVVGIGADLDMDVLKTYATFPNMAMHINDLNLLDSFKDNVREKLCDAANITAPVPPCDIIADYVLLLDRSGSISFEQFVGLLNFTRAVVDGFVIGADGALFSAVSFATQASLEFMLDDYTSKDELDEALRLLSGTYIGGNTNIAEAFEKACEVVEDDGNRAGIPDVVVLFTDGVPTVNQGDTMNQINAVKNKGATVCVVGIGSHIDIDSLRQYASFPDLVMTIPSLDDLDSFIAVLNEKLCDVDTDPCVECKDYDVDGYGYMGDARDCSKYFICKFNDAKGKGDKLFSMACPPGTMYNNQRANLGVPCVHIGSEDNCTNAGNGSVIDIYPCPYTTSEVNPSKFGIINEDGDLVHVQMCENGAVFIDSDDHCRCDDRPSDCKCILFIDFVGDVQDHSCNEAYVYNYVPQVTLKPGMINMGDAGSFRGLKPHKENGAHLSTYVMNGMFSTQCDAAHGQTQLTVALWFKHKYLGEDENRISSLVSYCDVNNGRALYINIEGNVVCAGLKTLDNAIVDLCATIEIITDDWYYVSLVYGQPNLDLYVTTEADYPTCGKVGQGPTCFPGATKPQSGCVEPRACGLDIGAGGASWKDDHFFVGHMDNVQVWREAYYWACSSPPP